MLLWVGLGNPGDKYAGNRHNIGFMAVDELVRRHSSFGPWRAKFSGQLCEGTIDGTKVLLLKPETYMNESGRSVSAAARFYKIESADILVFHDELDLPLGKMRVKTGGGHGGHNGLRSIDAHMGKDYGRVRLGIGHPGSKERVHGHVLSDFGKTERAEVDPWLDALAKHAPLLVKGNGPGFMNKVSLELKPAPVKKVKTAEQVPAASGAGPKGKEEDGSPFAVLKKFIKPD